MSATQLDGLLSALSVEFVRLTECLVSPGWRLHLGGTSAPGIHYNLSGHGRMVLEGHPTIELSPHTLVVTPPNQYFHIEVPSEEPESKVSNEMEGRWKSFPPGAIRRFVAGEEGPHLMLICGYFQASYGTSVNLFSTLNAPIVEQFDSAHHIDRTLRFALQELIDQEVGTGAMTTTLLKLVLIALLRRSLTSINLWVEQFSLLGDIHIARAFSHMAAHPAAPHSVSSLARTACLSRSSFMARFTKALGMPPMTVLKGLRMRQAASMLTTKLSVDQIARSVGYTSRSSFLRAFHNTYGKYPSDYRAQHRTEIASKTEMKIIMNDKLLLKNTMLNLEAEKLAYAEQAYVDYLHGSAPDYSEARDHGEFSLRFNEAEIALAFECPLHSYEDAIATIRAIDFGPKTEVEPGAVIQLEGQWFVVGTATAPFNCQGITYLGISTQAPIYQCLEGKRAGETCKWNDKDLQLNVVS